MPLQHTQRCPHFQLHTEMLSTEGPAAYLAVRHCLMTGRLLTLLQPFPGAQALTQHLVIRTQQNEPFAFVGPDLEAVTQAGCTQERCANSCTLAYAQTLQQFDVAAPQEESVECDKQTTASGAETMEAIPSSCTCF